MNLIEKLIAHRFKILLFIALLGFSYLFYHEMEKVKDQPVNAWSNPISADCAIVLTGSEGRVQKGFDLLSQKRVKKLIISGVFEGSRLIEIFPEWTYYPEVKENDIVLEKRSLTTYGNAAQSLPLVQALKCRDVILVTTALHMHRSYQIFRTTFPRDIFIHKYAMISKQFHPSPFQLSVEVLKSLFYSTWAY